MGFLDLKGSGCVDLIQRLTLNIERAYSKTPRLRVRYLLAAILASLLIITIGYIWMPPVPPSTGATRLEIDAPETVDVGSVATVTIRAVDENGNLDTRRTDVVDLSLNKGARARLSISTVELKGGEVAVTITDSFAETVVLTATARLGYSLLESDSVTITFQ